MNALPAHAVSSSAVAPAVVSVSVPANGSYTVGSSLSFTLHFNTAITVDTSGGTPQLQLLFDGPYSGVATYSGGSGSADLSFSYAVKAGDQDANGIVLGALLTQGATLRDSGGIDAAVALHGVADTHGVRLDTRAPTVQSLVPAGNPRVSGEATTYVLQFSEVVSGVDASDFTLAGNGSAAGHVGAVTTSDGRTYQVQLDALAGDGLLRLDLKSFNTGIVDGAGNAFTAGYSTGDSLTLDHQAPRIESVSVPGPGLYRQGNSLDFGLHFSEAVNFDSAGAAPRLLLSLQSGPAQATYLSGNGSPLLLFRYVVAAGDADRFGPSLLALDLPAGSLQDAAGNPAQLALNNVGTTTAVVIDATAAAVTRIELPPPGLYGAGRALDFVLHFNQVVTVGGTPSLALALDSGVATAHYLSGTGTDTLSFRYTVVPGDADPTGLTLASSIGLNGGTLRSASSQDALLSLTGSTAAPDLRIDGIAPQVGTVEGPAPGGYDIGQVLDFSVHFSEPVQVDGTGVAPGLALQLTSGPVLAPYVSGSGSNTLHFRYTISSLDDDRDGLALGELSAPGAGLRDAAGNTAVLALHGVADTSGVRIGDGDGIASGVEDQVLSLPGSSLPKGDGNGDGHADRLQANVVSGPVTALGQGPKPTTLVADALFGSGAEDLQDGNSAVLHDLLLLPAPAGLGAGIVVPYGLFAFTVDVQRPGERESFSLFVAPVHGLNGFWLADALGGWHEVSASHLGGQMAMQGGQLRLDFFISDGGANDLDGQVNGHITALGGAAFVPPAVVGVVDAQTLPHSAADTAFSA